MYLPHYKSLTALLDMHHLFCGISFLLRSVNLVLFTLLVHLIFIVAIYVNYVCPSSAVRDLGIMIDKEQDFKQILGYEEMFCNISRTACRSRSSYKVMNLYLNE